MRQLPRSSEAAIAEVGGGGAQRPVSRVIAPKKTGAFSAGARIAIKTH